MAKYDACIVFLLAKAYQKAHGNLKKRLTKYGLTPVQHLILEALWEEEGLSAGDIGQRLSLDGATLSGVLDRMNESGWVIKKTDRADKRVLRVRLSKRSKRLKTSLMDERKTANREILKKLSGEEKLLLKRLLRDVQG